MTRLVAHDIRVALGRRTVLPGLSLTLQGGQLVALLGPNGAGKSTLIRCFAGLLAPEAGEVRFDGRPLAELPVTERAHRIAYLPQERECRWPVTVARVAALGRPRRDGAVAAALAETDMTALAERPMDQLSGGERARALIARALAVDPAVLLADEPLAGLDPGHQLDILAVLRRRADAGALVVVVAHDLTLVPRFADRLVVLAEGRVVADAAPAVALAAPATAAAYGIALEPGSLDGGAFALPRGRLDAPGRSL
ncbi:ABC transporter ATP-binding protein [Desertibaculum subflavum]|uniref:ABC transporter ATP-binding protein n=1 Tax=Desertibaculum subflavum TaxID=2268458 RepID=UPI000E66AC95